VCLCDPYMKDNERATPGNAAEAAAEAGRQWREILAAVRSDQLHEYPPFTGESAALFRDGHPAAEILARAIAEAEEALKQASRCFGEKQH